MSKISLIKVGQEFGKWRYQREINRGGFGVVLEFKNVVSNHIQLFYDKY